jgi:cobalt/nickel transport protein
MMTDQNSQHLPDGNAQPRSGDLKSNPGSRPKSRRRLVVILIMIALVTVLLPLFALRDAEFAGSDDAGSEMVEEVTGRYEPWFEPVLETIIGRELPGEVETLFFCIQTGIGVGVIAWCFGYLTARRKYGGEAQ